MTKFFLLASAAIAAASPALARDAKPTDTAATAASQSASDMRASNAAPARVRETKYCVIDSVTGSRIKQRFCQTRAEWMLEGFDPLAK